MYLVVIILLMISTTILSVTMCVKLFSYKVQIRDITIQIKDFKDRKSNKKINTQIADKDIEQLALEINEYLELYKRNEQEKVVFEETLKQGIANMSHDLRTPLTSIIGYLKLLKEDAIDKDEVLDIIKNKTNKLNVLINDFFELASIESGDYKLDMRKVNLTNIVREEVLSLYETFQSKGFDPKISICDEPIFILGDNDSLERIIDNLLSNALKYAERDIEIKLEKIDDKVLLRISNICTSIRKDGINLIFNRFYMADQVRKGEGAGLGLSIAKSLIEKMDGTIVSKFKENKIDMICEWKYVN